MISAKEARCRVENAKAIKEVEKRLDFAIATAIENGNYKVSVVAPKELTEEGYDVVTKELTELGYTQLKLSVLIALLSFLLLNGKG